MSKRPGPDGILTPMPALMPTATLLLGLLVHHAKVFEFGSGGSTLWIAERADVFVSIEDDSEWHKAVMNELQARHLYPGLWLVEPSELASAIDETGEWDVVFVDCYQRQRRKAIFKARKHVKPGGWLIADDYDFPIVTKTINKLEQDGWDVAVLSGTKIHPVRKVRVKTATAFCHKPN